MIKWLSWPCQEKGRKKSFLLLCWQQQQQQQQQEQEQSGECLRFYGHYLYLLVWISDSACIFPGKSFVEYKRRRGRGEGGEGGRREETKNKKLNWCQQPSLNRKKGGGGVFLFLIFFFCSFAPLSLVGKVSMWPLFIISLWLLCGQWGRYIFSLYVCCSYSNHPHLASVFFLLFFFFCCALL